MFLNHEPVPTVLIVDDNVETLQIVKYALQKGGFDVKMAMSGEAALNLISEEGLPHLVLCDLNMPPGMDGFEFCRVISRWCDLPVIMLTAMDQAETVVEALGQYAEDYIIKPFTPDELVARTRRVLQRIGVFPFEPSARLVIGDDLKICFPDRVIYAGGRAISLTPTETKLLYVLLRRPGDTISYDFLLRRMWPREMVFEDRLHVFIHRLRHKLSRNHIMHQYVVLERGIGYRFDPFAEVELAV